MSQTRAVTLGQINLVVCDMQASLVQAPVAADPTSVAPGPWGDEGNAHSRESVTG